MSGLAELEKNKRRRLQEAYADLRPSGRDDDDRQVKLRNLLLGAAADAGLPPGLQPLPARAAGGRASGGGPRAVRDLAAATAASIAAVESIPTATATPKRSGAGGTGAGASDARWRRGPDGAAREPPPGPMDGGFLPEADPIQRLSRLQGPAGVPAAVLRDGAGPASVVSAAGGAAAGGSVRTAARPAQRRTYGTEYYDDGDDDGGGDAGVDVEVPSDVELALISLKSDLRAHPPSADLPPLALRSQLSCLLTDRSSVERQLDEQRRANRVRVFKLPTGMDEFGVLITADYRAVVREAADSAAGAAAAAVGGGDAGGGPRQQQQQTRATSSHGAYAAVATTGGRSRWHDAVEAFLCRVVDRCTEFELSRDHLLHLLRTPPPPQPPPPPASSAQQQQLQQRQQQQAQPWASSPQQGGQQVQRPCRGLMAGAQPLETPLDVEVEEQVSLLLHLGCLARHTDGDADAFVLAVPGAGRLVKAVLGGRRELLAWLSKRQHQEAPEEKICKLKLRSSCLPPLYHVRDLVGRGAAKRLDGTCGPMVKLPAKKGTGGPSRGSAV